MSTAPLHNVLYSVTHELDGTPIIRVPRTCKVSIGIPAGKDIHVVFNPHETGDWLVTVAKQNTRFKTMEEARKFYRQSMETAPEIKYPRKLDYYTFRRIGPEGTLEPDWQALAKNGSVPRILDIMFTDDAPLETAYEMWGAGRRKCFGDGLNARRVFELATPEQTPLVEAAKAAGERYFPIVDGCKLKGCPYAKPDAKGVIPCKPHGRLSFQLIHNPSLGGKAEFNTTGYRSITQLFSSLRELLRITGGGDEHRGFVAGIPLQLVLKPYMVTHNGKLQKQYGVSLEFRAESFEGLRKKLLEYGAEFHAALGEPSKLLSAPDLAEGEIEMPAEEAAALEAEFFAEQAEPEEDFEGETEKPATESDKAETATAKAAEGLKEKMRKTRKPAVEAVTATPAPASASVLTPTIPPPAPAEPTPDPAAAVTTAAAETGKREGEFF